MERTGLVHVAPSGYPNIVRMSWSMRNTFNVAARSGRVSPRLVALIDEPGALEREARAVALQTLREQGRLCPRYFLLSRSVCQILLVETMPTDLVGQAALAAPLRVLIEQSDVAAYWFLAETWFATADGTDPAVEALRPSQRESRSEGVMIITAKPGWFAVELHETVRDARGAVIDLIPTAVDTEGLTPPHAPALCSLFDRDRP